MTVRADVSSARPPQQQGACRPAERSRRPNGAISGYSRAPRDGGLTHTVGTPACHCYPLGTDSAAFTVAFFPSMAGGAFERSDSAFGTRDVSLGPLWPRAGVHAG